MVQTNTGGTIHIVIHRPTAVGLPKVWLAAILTLLMRICSTELLTYDPSSVQGWICDALAGTHNAAGGRLLLQYSSHVWFKGTGIPAAMECWQVPSLFAFPKALRGAAALDRDTTPRYSRHSAYLLFVHAVCREELWLLRRGLTCCCRRVSPLYTDLPEVFPKAGVSSVIEPVKA